MPVQATYPGVYIQEVRSGVRTITGVSTSVTLFVGMALRGRIDHPERVLSFAEFERIYGNDPGYGELTDQVRQFFLNGGQRAFIVRTAGGTPDAAMVPIQNEGAAVTVLELAARDAGKFGESIRAAIDYDTPSPESTFNLRIFRERVKDNGELEVVEDQRFTDLSMNPADARFVERAVNVSDSLVVAKVPNDVKTNAATLDPSARRIAGYSLSGLRFAAATALGDIRNAINAILGVGRRIQLSVDGGPFFTVALNDLPAGFALGPVPDWANPINLAVAPAAVNVAFVDLGPGHRFFRIQSQNAAGGTVVVRPALGGDAAVALQLGVAQGGLEVSGFAPQRPAPSGLFASLGNLATGPTTLLAIGVAPRATINWTLTDSVGPHTGAATYPGAAGALFFHGPTVPAVPFGGSLLQVREALRQLGASIASTLPKAEKWTASMQGFRLVLTPAHGTVDRDVDGVLTSTAPPFDIGGANMPFAGDANSRAYRLGDASPVPLPYRDVGTAGDNGTTPTLDDYERVYGIVRREVDLFNLLVLPRGDGQTDAQRADLWGPASVFAQSERAFLLVDPPSTWTDADVVDAEITNARIGVVKDHAAIYWPRVKVPRGPSTAAIDPGGSIAGLMARIDASRGVWKSAAGTEADLRGVRDVDIRISDLENGVINPQAVNAIRLFPAGVVSWGARTMDGFDNSGNDDYKYVAVRRLALMIEESLYRGLQFAVFEPNDEPLWAQIRLAAGAFMNNLFRQGAFAGQKASDAYFVKCDAETTTQNDINLGIVNVIVAFAPLKPAEFVIVTIKQKAGQVQV